MSNAGAIRDQDIVLAGCDHAPLADLGLILIVGDSPIRL